MIELEWLRCKNPSLMLIGIYGKPGNRLRHFCESEVGNRKLRMYAVACCRSVEHLFLGASCRRAVEVAERIAEGVMGKVERNVAVLDMENVISHATDTEAGYEATLAAYRAVREIEGWYAALEAAYHARRAIRLSGGGVDMNTEAREQCWLLHCIFGTLPFRPLSINPGWLTWNDGTVPKLAEVLYEERRFSDLPILADALEEAGCDNADILNHCRNDKEHVRGCWVVDLLLGKK